MKYLLDTCALITLANGGHAFSQACRQAMNSPTAVVYVSVVSAAEVSIKAGKGKLSLGQSVHDWLVAVQDRHRLQILALGLPESCTAGGLPWIHSDPFDRLLIATAQTHNCCLVTCDQAICQYPHLQHLW